MVAVLPPNDATGDRIHRIVPRARRRRPAPEPPMSWSRCCRRMTRPATGFTVLCRELDVAAASTSAAPLCRRAVHTPSAQGTTCSLGMRPWTKQRRRHQQHRSAAEPFTRHRRRVLHAPWACVLGQPVAANAFCTPARSSQRVSTRIPSAPRARAIAARDRWRPTLFAHRRAARSAYRPESLPLQGRGPSPPAPGNWHWATPGNLAGELRHQPGQAGVCRSSGLSDTRQLALGHPGEPRGRTSTPARSSGRVPVKRAFSLLGNLVAALLGGQRAHVVSGVGRSGRRP